MSLNLETVDPRDARQMAQATREGIERLRDAARVLASGYQAPAFAQEIARTLHLNAGSLRHTTARYGFPPAERREFLRALDAVMREFREFL